MHLFLCQPYQCVASQSSLLGHCHIATSYYNKAGTQFAVHMGQCLMETSWLSSEACYLIWEKNCANCSNTPLLLKSFTWMSSCRCTTCSIFPCAFPDHSVLIATEWKIKIESVKCMIANWWIDLKICRCFWYSFQGILTMQITFCL